MKLAARNLNTLPSPHHSSLQWVNVGLAIAALSLLLYYVVQVNAMAAQTWKLTAANEQLAALQEERNTLVAQRASLDDHDTLSTVATAAGLVPAGTVVYLVQDHSVAAR